MKRCMISLFRITSPLLLACVVFIGCGSSGYRAQSDEREAKSAVELSPEPDASAARIQQTVPTGPVESLSEYVQIKVYPSYDRIHPGMDLKIAIDLKINTEIFSRLKM